MSVFRWTLYFAARNIGWSETHWMQNATTDPLTLKALCDVGAQKRADLLGNPFGIIGYRIAAYANDASTARVARAVANSKQQFIQGPNAGTGDAEPAAVAINMFGGVLNAPNVNRTQLGAPSDAAVSVGGQVNKGAGNLGNLLNAYWDFLAPLQPTTTFGFGTVQTDIVSPLTDIVQNTNGTVTFSVPTVVPNDTFPNRLVGKVVPVRVKGINNGVSVLNRAFNCFIKDGHTAVTKEKIAFATDQSDGVITTYNPIRQYVPYARAKFVISDIAGNHRRGRPFGSPAGRAKKQLRA